MVQKVLFEQVIRVQVLFFLYSFKLSKQLNITGALETDQEGNEGNINDGRLDG